MKSLENREETYVQMLRKREQDIMNLDDKLGQLEQKKLVSRYGVTLPLEGAASRVHLCSNFTVLSDYTS